MEPHSQKFKIRLGLFIAIGIALFVAAIFIIGRQKNLFNPVIKLNSTFYNVSGLQVGNNIRFAGINVGTVDNIRIVNDTTVTVEMMIRKEIQQFIKSDCRVSIGSEGLIGDRLVTITQGSSTSKVVNSGQYLASNEPVETDAILGSLQVTAGNAEIISGQLAEIMVKVNSGNGTLGKLIQDSTIAENLNQTMNNLKKSTKGLDENMQAAKHNILFKGYFKNKAKDENKKKQELK
ncbi:MAG: MCE family protein [Bacteroidetes bacterium]|nr:MCE family protein [Bacteroidota bacterium]